MCRWGYGTSPMHFLHKWLLREVLRRYSNAFEYVYVSYAWLCILVYMIRVFLMCIMLVLLTIWLKVLLDMHVVDYSIMFEVWSTCFNAYGLMIGLLSMCEVMGLHEYIALGLWVRSLNMVHCNAFRVLDMKVSCGVLYFYDGMCWLI